MYIDFNKTKNYSKYWNNVTKISFLERHVLIHSYSYYCLNTSYITDKKFDELCKQLMDMIKQYPEDFKESEYYYCFQNFDGTTGFDLFYKLNDVDKEMIIKIHGCILNSKMGDV